MMPSRLENLASIEDAFGFVPRWLDEMPDEVLDQYWANHLWLCNDSALSLRDKMLIAFGAATAIHCNYRIPFHTAQLQLAGTTDEQLREAAWLVQNVVGASAYLNGVRYDEEIFQDELDRLVEYIKTNEPAHP
jgi:AhpD family alkylhydroperoxidase